MRCCGFLDYGNIQTRGEIMLRCNKKHSPHNSQKPNKQNAKLCKNSICDTSIPCKWGFKGSYGVPSRRVCVRLRRLLSFVYSKIKVFQNTQFESHAALSWAAVNLGHLVAVLADYFFLTYHHVIVNLLGRHWTTWCLDLQGDHSVWANPPVDIKTKVLF